MNTPKHTPGPWSVDGHNLTAVISNQGSEIWPQWKHICNCNYGYADPEKHFEENCANAKLIAAAPLLLKELIHLVRLLEPMEKDGSLDIPGLATLNGARKAIKKATE